MKLPGKEPLKYGGHIFGVIMGFILGLIMGLMNVPLHIIQYTGAALGAVIGLLISIVPVKMILGKDYGEFRLVLLKKEQAVSEE